MAGLVALGCTRSSQINTPGGNKGFAVSCLGNVGRCYSQAGEDCGRSGYEVVDRSSVMDANGWVRHELIVECR